MVEEETPTAVVAAVVAIPGVVVAVVAVATIQINKPGSRNAARNKNTLVNLDKAGNKGDSNPEDTDLAAEIAVRAAGIDLSALAGAAAVANNPSKVKNSRQNRNSAAWIHVINGTKKQFSRPK